MKEAKIAVFEDSELIQTMFQRAAESANHTIVATAQTLEESERVIDLTDFDVAVVDGNLDSDGVSCGDGLRIISKIRSQKVGAKIIWFSTIPATAVNAESDFDTGKDVFGALDLIDKI